MSAISFDDVDVGDELPSLQLTLSGEEVRRYATAANMPDGRFMNDAQAQAEGLPGQIVPGNFSMALLSRLLTGWSAGVRVRRLGCTYRQLVRPNMALILRGMITDKHSGDHGHFVECDVVIENADGERLVTGTATLVLPCNETSRSVASDR